MVEGALYVKDSGTEGLSLIKRAIGHLGSYRGGVFWPFLDREREVFGNEDVAAFNAEGETITFTHDALARSENTRFYIRISYFNSNPHLQQIRLVVPEDAVGSRLQPLWQIFRDIMLGFTDALKPSLALATVTQVDESGADTADDDELPMSEDVSDDGLPRVLLPWNYFGPDRLTDDLAAFLGTLDAFKSEQHGEGWLLEVVADVTQPPSHEFLDSLKSASVPHPISYRQLKFRAD
jgi:hypothetical protein